MIRMGTRLAIGVLALTLALTGTTAFAAYKNTAAGALRDCGAGHDPLRGHYTVAVLQKALGGLSTSNAEYSTCATALANAIRALERPHHPRKHPKPPGTRGNNGGGGPHTTTTQTQTHTRTSATSTSDSGTADPITGQLSGAVKQGHKPVSIDGQIVTPGAIVTRNSSFPTPIVIVLAALAAVLAVLGGLKARSIVRARRSD